MAQGVKANISEETLTELLKKYTITETADILQLNASTVRRYKNKYGIKTNSEIAKKSNSQKHTKYSCDINYFDNIDTMDKAYLLGFICADGFVAPRNEVGIGVSSKDEDIVLFFQKQL